MSAVCQEALERALHRLERCSGEDPELSAVAARLLQSKEAEDERKFNDGFAFGSRWAKKSAGWYELRYVGTHDPERFGRIDLDRAVSLQSALFSDALDQGYDADPDWFDYLSFGSAYDRGVVAGAASVYETVKRTVEHER